LHAGERARCFILPVGIGFIGNRNEKTSVDDIGGKLDLIGRNQIAFPKLKGPTLDGCLIGNRAENEAPVWFQIVILEKLAATLKGQIGSVHEVFVKGIALRVDVVDFVSVLAVDDKQDVR
jgi:hypothetical protein